MFELSISGIKEARAAVGDLPVEKALRSTRNKLAAKAKTATSKEIRKTYNIKARDLSANMIVQRARGVSDPAYLIASGPRISLIYFDAQETRISGSDAIISKRAIGKTGTGGIVQRRVRAGKKQRGVTVKVRKDNGRKLVKGKHGHGGFIAAGRRGKVSSSSFGRLFNRSESKQGRGNIQLFERQKQTRLPLDKLTGPSVSQMLNGKLDVVTELVRTDADHIFNNELDHFAAQLVRQQIRQAAR